MRASDKALAFLDGFRVENEAVGSDASQKGLTGSRNPRLGKV